MCLYVCPPPSPHPKNCFNMKPKLCVTVVDIGFLDSLGLLYTTLFFASYQWQNFTLTTLRRKKLLIGN